jgi:phage baseplate assembly protein W|tara:strand:- start:10039 stop:10461 length:423 start_codon:yes stop_codon:yes gene_type:complete
MAWDASRQNEKNSSRVYKDLNLNFSANPVTGDVNKVTDVNCIKRSIRNLLLTNHYDRPFHPEIGSNIPSLLFENFGPITGNQISRSVEETIVNFEPRARVESVEAFPVPDTNTYDVRVYFYVENMPAELQEFQTLLESVR